MIIAESTNASRMKLPGGFDKRLNSYGAECRKVCVRYRRGGLSCLLL
jgi:hypothetical protein